MTGRARWRIPCAVAGLLLLLVAPAARPAAAGEPPRAEPPGIPGWAAEALRGRDFTRDYALSTRLTPSQLEGDFDGDGRLDVAVLVSRRGNGAQGIAFLRAASPGPVVVGAGHALGNGGDDFSWMDAWSVYPRDVVARGADESAPPRLRGDALLVEKLEAASALVYWDGAAYRWYQQGD